MWIGRAKVEEKTSIVPDRKKLPTRLSHGDEIGRHLRQRMLRIVVRLDVEAIHRLRGDKKLTDPRCAVPALGESYR